MPTDIEQAEGSDVRRLREQGVPDLADQFTKVRERLRKMIAVRLDDRLRNRVGASDVVQEVFIEAARRLPEYLNSPQVSVYIWLRQLGRQALAMHYRKHIGTSKRDAGREVAIDHVLANTESLVAEFAESMASPESMAAKAELQQQLLKLIESMEPTDREVLSLKQLEMLSFDEIAQELGISVVAAKKRFQRAAIRLGKIAKHLGNF